ncbi:MAG: hypothetical protein WBY44_33485 [Bryobacteraceae bacterium]
MPPQDGDRSLVGGGVGDLVDDNDFDGAFSWPQLEAELFLENGDEGRVSRPPWSGPPPV